MKNISNGSDDSEYITKLKTLSIKTGKKSAPPSGSNYPKTINCACGGTYQATKEIPTPMGPLVKYQHRRRQHDDSAEQSLTA